MIEHGFVRVAAAVPPVVPADTAANLAQTAALVEQAADADAHLVVFPELGLTGYTCADLFHQTALQQAALAGLAQLCERTSSFPGLVVIGLPWLVGDRLYNTAAVLQRGQLLGVVPKTYLANYKEFYEARWFTPGTLALADHVRFQGQPVPFGTDLLFDASAEVPGFVVGLEICEDLWVPVPPSSLQALGGARILVNLSASNEVLGKAPYREGLVASQSGRCIAGYVYASSGPWESTTDLVFGGHALIAENGALLGRSPRFARTGHLTAVEIDVQRLDAERQRQNSFLGSEPSRPWRRIACEAARPPRTRLLRHVEPWPFVPQGESQLAERCQEIFSIQVSGLATRLERLRMPAVQLGISGGLDSTLALLVACKTMDVLGQPRSKIHGVTMPGFGTSSRTLTNARAVMGHLGVTAQEIDIRLLCLEEMRAIGHRPFGLALDRLNVEAFAARLQEVEGHDDLVFENVQARMRTSLLMNRGFVVGTGDLSELALGWCTYNGDHISMYNPNVSIPKTLVKFLVRWAAQHEFAAEAQSTLLDIVDTTISPELLPHSQETERVVGPYELHDFFLFHFLRYGAPPAKILFLAQQTPFAETYGEQIAHWLQVFLKRFFANQFKRSCLPDGPKVGTVSLSPRGDWRMPSDASAAAWSFEG